MMLGPYVMLAWPVGDDMELGIYDDTELEYYRINAALFDMIKESQSKHPADFQIEERGDNEMEATIRIETWTTKTSTRTTRTTMMTMVTDDYGATGATGAASRDAPAWTRRQRPRVPPPSPPAAVPLPLPAPPLGPAHVHTYIQTYRHPDINTDI